MTDNLARARVFAIRQASRSRVDWFRICADLKRCGWSVWELAEATGIARGKIRGWQQHGHEPRYCDGVMMISVWCAITGKAPDQVPMCHPPASAASMK